MADEKASETRRTNPISPRTAVATKVCSAPVHYRNNTSIDPRDRQHQEHL